VLDVDGDVLYEGLVVERGQLVPIIQVRLHHILQVKVNGFFKNNPGEVVEIFDLLPDLGESFLLHSLELLIHNQVHLIVAFQYFLLFESWLFFFGDDFLLLYHFKRFLGRIPLLFLKGNGIP